MIRLPLRPFLSRSLRRPISTPYRCVSSSSPSTSSTEPPDNAFIKTGERKEPRLHVHADEYSQSGGDSMVAAQSEASFGADANSDRSKDAAGKGNMVNPLEFSPATPSLSETVESRVEKAVERTEGMRTGPGVTKKTKVVVKSELDFDTVKHKSSSGSA